MVSAVSSGVALAPEVKRVVTETTERTKRVEDHFLRLMRLLQRDGVFDGLQLNSRGELCVNWPFCGSFTEVTALSRFLAQELLPTMPNIQKVRIFGADVMLTGADAMVSLAPKDPRLEIEVKHSDLSEEPLPAAALTIGLHPQPLTKTPSRVWERIISNVLRSSERCVFTTWMKAEADELSRLCQGEGYVATVALNPSPLDDGVSRSRDSASASMMYHWIVRVQPRGSVAP